MHKLPISSPQSGIVANSYESIEQLDFPSPITGGPPTNDAGSTVYSSSSFWLDRLVEVGLILSMALYYLIGNQNIKVPGTNLISVLSHLNPQISWPFLVLFLALAWYRLPVAVALLPLSLPFYLQPKDIYGKLQFSPAEIALWSCLALAFLQALLQRRKWPYALSLSALRDRLGPFLIPILLFFVMSLVSIGVAYSKGAAERTFREEILGPILYVCLVCFCFRSREDVKRLLAALFGSGFVIALLGLLQFYFFKSTIRPDSDNLYRITTVYGSANSIALLFDYTLPLGLALVLARTSWKIRVAALLLCVPVFYTLILSDSRGSALIGIPFAALFLIACWIRNRKALLISAASFILICCLLLAAFYQPLYKYLEDSHSNQQGVSTVSKRLWLWQTALDMIHDRPWLGFGLDNWLCYYSNSWENICLYPVPPKPSQEKDAHGHYEALPPTDKLHAYWILRDSSGKLTGMGQEPTLSHPHNIFLQVWVSIGVFGLLAFVALIVLFCWLLIAMLSYLRKESPPHAELWRWMILAVGAAMLAAVAHGQIDSSVFEQDLAFCFWMMIAALLIIRHLMGMPWRYMWAPRRVSSSARQDGAIM